MSIRRISATLVPTLAAVLMLMMLTGCKGKSAESLVAQGAQAARDGRASDAIKDYTDAIAAEPRNAAAHEGLGEVLMGQGQLPSAEEQYRAAVALEPANAGYRVGLGSLLRAQTKFADAEREDRTAIGLDAKSGTAHYELAKLLSQVGNRDAEAQNEFDQARAIDPNLVPPAPAASPTPAAAQAAPAASTTPGVSAAGAPPKVKPLNKRFLLTHNSPVYQNPDSTSKAVAEVHKNKFVRVTGIAGNWLQVTLKNGTVGYIPTGAAE